MAAGLIFFINLTSLFLQYKILSWLSKEASQANFHLNKKILIQQPFCIGSIEYTLNLIPR